MTTPNDVDNGTPAPSEPDTSGRRPGRTARSKSPASAGGGLVKAEGHGAVIVLEDNTRLVESDTLPNHRPIALSTFQVVGSLDRAGDRPIAANTFEVSNTDTLPGHRPIAVSTLHIADLHVLPGDRPIAPNDVIDPPAAVLMGYLD